MEKQDQEDDLDWFDKDFDQVVANISKKVEKKKEKEKIHENKNVAKIPQKSGMESKKTKNKYSKFDNVPAIPMMSFTKLEKIANRDPYKMLMEVFLHYESFMESHQTEAPENLLKLLHIDSKIIQLPFYSHVQKLVQDLCANQPFWTEILKFIKQVISSPGSFQMTLFLNVEQFWQDLEEVINYILVNYSQDKWKIVREFFTNLSAIPVTPQIEKILRIRVMVGQNKAVDNIYEVYPSINDIKTDNSELIKNKVIGEYENVDEYLKVHLPLLKQDFLSPLKAGIKEYFESPNPSEEIQSNQHVFIYPQAKIVIKHKQIDVGHSKFIAIKLQGVVEKIASKRFMNGQLLCLTTSKNIDALILAVVTTRDSELIKEGFVEVDIVQMENVQDLMNDQFVMFEPRAYFDPHYHVFNTIKNFNDLNFPFDQYFLKLKKTADYPDYIKEASQAQYDLKQYTFDMKDPSKWPLPEQLKLQEQQYLALQSALKNKLTLIQGPPGTGKTFIGLEILEALLKNTENEIVILTSTNDALDKFILDAGKIHDHKEIIRLGGQSKNEEIKKFLMDANPVRSNFSQTYHGILKTEQKKAVTLMQRSMGFEEVRIAQQSINCYSRMIEENKQMSTNNLIKGKRIIGMTCSYAARCCSIIKMMNAPIVIVEEAAEILESQLISCLSKNVQQIILIGDHQQLRPQINTYDLAKIYKFDVSLFERLVLNDMHVITMNVQMRMSPVICDLLRLTIYPELADGECVKHYPKVKGTASNIAWIDHNYPESNDLTSKKNVFEAQFLVRICEFLVKIGNQPSEITILTPYSAQLTEINNFMDQHPAVSGVRATILDTFQGEENNIILLSLVRSNSTKDIGFLTSNNRISVLLSRAKFGFFIVGCTSIFKRTKSVWKQVIEQLDNNSMLVSGFVTECAHGSFINRTPEDFDDNKCSCIE